jgi:hypothetical protein
VALMLMPAWIAWLVVNSLAINAVMLGVVVLDVC